MYGEDRLSEERWRRVVCQGHCEEGGQRRRPNQILLLCRGQKHLLSPRGGDGILKFPRMKRFLEDGRIKREKESVLHSVEDEQMGGSINIKVREQGEFV